MPWRGGHAAWYHWLAETGPVSFEVVPVDKPADMNVIIGQAHFIKTVEDLHEALAGVSPHLRFGLTFCEASSARLVRRSGNDDELTGQAAANALAIGAGHSFVILLREGSHQRAEPAQGRARGLHHLLRHRVKRGRIRQARTEPLPPPKARPVPTS